MAKLTTHAVLAVLTIGMQAVGPAGAQVGPDARPYIYGRPGPDRDAYAPPPPGGRPPPPADDGYGWRPPPPPFEDEYDRPRPRWPAGPGRRWDDSVCVTARGTCLTRPAPPDAPCGCDMPGFGYKRGRIAD
ncbi:hypothetical protein SAMN02799622_06085 [Methylobacterium sp. UNC378MF]|uniref:hypothetical protein n=1 Tax=Methylobacterium sp. UNC378MF TaxID=1502748 RepID=UPI000880E1F4|nr:hypothetical protein [Methylobacterium sp. UNC378MF]SDA35415.1 hypothetical protein SAMN02799622_06085 [Methylobacterium sp. UNC378MF]